MRKTLILTFAAVAALAPAAWAQTTMTTPSQMATPVMPAPREATNPNTNTTPMNNSLTEGRAVAPAPPMVERAPGHMKK